MLLRCALVLSGLLFLKINLVLRIILHEPDIFIFALIWMKLRELRLVSIFEFDGDLLDPAGLPVLQHAVNLVLVECVVDCLQSITTHRIYLATSNKIVYALVCFVYQLVVV